MTLPEKMFAGAFSALPATVLTAPVERVKCLLQIQGEEVRSLHGVALDGRCVRPHPCNEALRPFPARSFSKNMAFVPNPRPQQQTQRASFAFFMATSLCQCQYIA